MKCLILCIAILVVATNCKKMVKQQQTLEPNGDGNSNSIDLFKKTNKCQQACSTCNQDGLTVNACQPCLKAYDGECPKWCMEKCWECAVCLGIKKVDLDHHVQDKVPGQEKRGGDGNENENENDNENPDSLKVLLKSQTGCNDCWPISKSIFGEDGLRVDHPQNNKGWGQGCGDWSGDGKPWCYASKTNLGYNNLNQQMCGYRSTGFNQFKWSYEPCKKRQINGQENKQYKCRCINGEEWSYFYKQRLPGGSCLKDGFDGCGKYPCAVKDGLKNFDKLKKWCYVTGGECVTNPKIKVEFNSELNLWKTYDCKGLKNHDDDEKDRYNGIS